MAFIAAPEVDETERFVSGGATAPLVEGMAARQGREAEPLTAARREAQQPGPAQRGTRSAAVLLGRIRPGSKIR